jgi:hypothetical protein
MSSSAALAAQNPSLSFDRLQEEEFCVEGAIREVRWPEEGHQAGGRIIAIIAGKSLSVLGRCETPLREGDRIRAIGKKSSLKPNPYRKDAQDFHATVIIALPPKDHDARVRLLQREVSPPRARHADGMMRPVEEEAISDHVRPFLKRELTESGIVLNREELTDHQSISIAERRLLLYPSGCRSEIPQHAQSPVKPELSA